ncbi:GLPGLI family protein [Flavobacterium cerinum]|nr:GLPGLI family protein [Flavobacterium cerinum]
MKLYLYIFSLLLSSFTFAQSKTTAIVEYKQVNNGYFRSHYYCTLFIEGTTTIFLPKYNTTYVTEGEKINNEPKEIYPDWEYLKIDHGKQQICFFGAFSTNFFLIKDDYNKLNWIISEEVKTIGGYQCTKATTNFRGVDWIVWFAPEIALPYGPWKLHGLPGLILEASAGKGSPKWIVEKIEYKNGDIFDKDFKMLVDTKNKEAIPLKEFLEKNKEWSDNVTAKMKQERPDSTIYTAPIRGDYEEKYEWEE